ncbi:hypothetical protein LCGC14_0909430 [marine sediment metagenome]|uniref:Uncharacterized protein n=1 Tax=marine sediment metagenome TaxID=412755 RepID=A0A0F9RD08_9ZZZZ
MTNQMVAKIQGRDAPRYYDPLVLEASVNRQVRPRIHETARQFLRFKIWWVVHPVEVGLLHFFLGDSVR